MRWLALYVLVLALVAAGCGGGDDEAPASDETTVEETVIEVPTEDTTEDSESAGGDTDFDFADEDCQSLVAAYAGVSAAFAAAAGGSGGDLSEQAEAFADYADDVPDEIRADVETLAAAYGQYIEVIQDAGLEPGEIPSAAQAQQFQDALQDVGSEDVTAASERLSAWTEENCTG
ncbi:MAG TPA: hypothetical protein VMN35_03820 [Gaiellaceae bacterium]|nr:hypothetical protein [Gaiellaceae bacterium]